MTRLKRILYVLAALLAGNSLRAATTTIVSGKATYYHRDYIGKPMANGQPYDASKLTCASWDFPLGSVLVVTYISRSGQARSVRVTVTDRGPAKRLVESQNRRIDLSWAAFRALENHKVGVIDVVATRVE